MSAILGLLLFCALVAVVVAVVRSMLRHWVAWLGSALVVSVLLIIFNIWYYGGRA